MDLVVKVHLTLEKYLISITCRNYVDSTETVLRVILPVEILWSFNMEIV